MNSFLRDALGDAGSTLDPAGNLEIPVTSMRGLFTALDAEYPGCRNALSSAAVAIDGDIYTDALIEPLNETSEVVFIPAIEGG